MDDSISLNDVSTKKSSSHKPLGELLCEAGLISAQQIEVAMKEQLDNPQIRIGEIFASKGWIKQKTADFFVERWSILLNQAQKQPLAYYFHEAALLDKHQIETILQEQKSRQEKIRFHRLAVQQGWLSQQTVNFFVSHLIDSRKSQKYKKFPTTTPYELLKNYVRGETNFQRAELKRIQLNYVTLKGVNINSSNLVKAQLKQANLNNSTLKQANLSSANLEKALLKGVNFESACLSQVNLTDAHLEGSNFTGADLREADLRDAYFVNVSFQGADLRKAKLQGANFHGSTYSGQTNFDPDFDPVQAGMELQ